MTAVTIYRSSDASAPILTGSVGALLSVLDACLVNGYGSQSAAGWTKPYANSGNIGCYRNSPTDGTGMCLTVNDNGPGAGVAREARMTGFTTLTSVSTGTGQFPTSAQLAIGTGALVCRKSATADTTTVRSWTLIADDTVFYFFPETGDLVSPTIVYPFFFGDIFSYNSSDAYRCIIIGRNAENTNSSNYDGFAALHAPSTSFLAQTMIGHYMAATWTGVGGSIPVGKHVDHGKMGTFGLYGSISGATSALLNVTPAFGIGYAGTNVVVSGMPMNLDYPNAPDGGLYVSPIWIHHSGSIRGYFKGLWAPMHTQPLGHNQTYNGSGNLSGKSFVSMAIIYPAYGGSAAAGELHIETSSTWS